MMRSGSSREQHTKNGKIMNMKRFFLFNSLPMGKKLTIVKRSTNKHLFEEEKEGGYERASLESSRGDSANEQGLTKYYMIS